MLQFANFRMKHFFILLSLNTEVARYKLHTMLKILNLFCCWVCLWGLWGFEIELFLHNAWMSNCQCFELNIINHTIQACFQFGNQNLLCHLNSWWTSFTHLLTIAFILKPEECFNFCAVACWLLVVTTGLDVAWRNYQRITWAIFPRENPEFYYKVGNRGGKFKTRGLRQCLLWYLPWFSAVQITVLSNV